MTDTINLVLFLFGEQGKCVTLSLLTIKVQTSLFDFSIHIIQKWKFIKLINSLGLSL